MNNASQIKAITDNRPKLKALPCLPKKCLECGIELNSNLKYSTKRRFCSIQHSKRYYGRIRLKKHILETYGNLSKTCLECGEKINPSLKWLPQRKFCCKLHQRQYDSRNWALRQNPPKFDDILQSLANRQESSPKLEIKPSCEVCGQTGQESRLILHHIRYNPVETVTLCRNCHGSLHMRILKGKKVNFEINREKKEDLRPN